MFTANERIHDIVARQASAGAVLHRFDIDPGTQAGDTVGEACAKLQLSLDQVLERLEEANQRDQGSEHPDVSGYSLTRLIQYVVRVHHRYIRYQLPELIALARETANADPIPALDDAVSLLEALRAAMRNHFEGEEQILFPCIAQLDEGANLAGSPACVHLRGIAGNVFVMVQEHESVAHLLEQLEERTNGFALPDGASAHYKTLLAGMRMFKADLQRHLELEDSILFPRALALEMTKKL